jgi:ubiquinone/menaquinone biosynthesis C-methylase UbiE
VSFDRVAPFYHTLEAITFGNALQRARVRWIGELGDRRRALILGEGNGRFVCELVRAHPDLQIECVDDSGRMLALAERRLSSEGHRANVRFVRQNIAEWEPMHPYDLIVTHFVLDCFAAEEMETIVQKLARAAMPGATWLLADFTVPPGKLAALQAKAWLRIMYAFFRITAGLRTKELVDATPYLRRHGFSCAAREVSRAGMLKSEMWSR